MRAGFEGVRRQLIGDLDEDQVAASGETLAASLLFAAPLQGMPSRSGMVLVSLVTRSVVVMTIPPPTVTVTASDGDRNPAGTPPATSVRAPDPTSSTIGWNLPRCARTLKGATTRDPSADQYAGPFGSRM